MSTSVILEWFDYLWEKFWDFLNDLNMFGGLTARDLLISFMMLSAIFAFIFKKVAPSNE